MTDLRKTIIPKSDQLNADDFISGPRTIKVTRVSLLAGDQPVAINFEGDDGKPYKPCKSMRRVLISIWGGDGNAFVGRSMTLYKDPKVKWGGEEIGGIRISHMSHIDREISMALTATRGSRKPYTVKPLAITTNTSTPVADPVDDNVFADIVQEAKEAAERGTPVLMSFWNRITIAQQKYLANMKEGLKARAAEVDESNREPSNPLMAG